MEDVCVRKLVDLIFVKKFDIVPEMLSPDSYFLKCMQNDGFLLKLSQVFCVRHLVTSLKYVRDVGKYKTQMSHSYEGYILTILGLCYREHHCHQNIFDSFIGVCGLVKYFCTKILEIQDVNLCDFSFDIVMEFYDSVMKSTFLRCGGFRRLVEYIGQHKYLSWNVDSEDFSLLPDSTIKKFENELAEERQIFDNNPLRDVLNITKAMAQRILFTLSAKYRTLPKRLEAAKASSLKNESKTTGQQWTERTTQLEYLDLSDHTQGYSNSKSKKVSKPIKDIAQYEEFAQEVKPRDPDPKRIANASKDGTKTIEQQRTEKTTQFESFKESDEANSKSKQVSNPIKDIAQYEEFAQEVRPRDTDPKKIANASSMKDETNTIEQQRTEKTTQLESLKERDEVNSKSEQVPKPIEDIAQHEEFVKEVKPRDPDPKKIANASSLKDEMKTIEQQRTEKTTQFQSLEVSEQGYSDSKSEQVSKLIEDIAQYEDVVQKVIKYNYSILEDDYSENDVLQKAGGILKHSKSTIESFIEILDEHDKE